MKRERAVSVRWRSARGGLIGCLTLALAFALSCAGERDSSAIFDPNGEDPGATETNFFRLPCDEDSDCSEGERCVLPEDPDGGPPAGRCVSPGQD
jgi:hypothetical protein